MKIAVLLTIAILVQAGGNVCMSLGMKGLAAGQRSRDPGEQQGQCTENDRSGGRRPGDDRAVEPGETVSSRLGSPAHSRNPCSRIQSSLKIFER